jgi:hypothetical protein
MDPNNAKPIVINGGNIKMTNNVYYQRGKKYMTNPVYTSIVKSGVVDHVEEFKVRKTK